jgi:rSAM/selenodomain-associated transferase 2
MLNGKMDGGMERRVSIIIPTLDEQATIGALVHHLRKCFPEAEVIVADGGSQDQTVRLVEGMALVVRASRGRATQMNAGARAASGDVLWFLHADCWPSMASVDIMLDALEDGCVLGGGFRWELAGFKWYYKPLTTIAHLKNKLRRNLFGDMGIFVRKDVFEQLGGYKELPIFEEVEFNNRLRRLGKTVILDEPLPSSDRKLLEEGPMWAFIKNAILKAAYFLGFSPEYLKRFY